jgi:hypothetical protein
MRIIRPDENRIMRWKNGGGTTTEIAIDPPEATVAGPFRWRLSIADVERSGPFSAFPGYDRTIMMIRGRGMDLVVGDQPPHRVDRSFEPFVFSGDETADCRLLDGPIRDFNLMVARSSLRSRVDVLHLDDGSRRQWQPSGEAIIHCFLGAVDLAVAGGPGGRLQANCTAIVSAVTSALQMVVASGGATFARIELTPYQGSAGSD